MKKITLSVAALALAINTYSQEFFDVTPYLKDNDSVFVDYNFRDVDTTDLVNVFQLRERMFINKDSDNNKISRDLADKYINILKYISSKTYNFNETFEYRK